MGLTDFFLYFLARLYWFASKLNAKDGVRVAGNVITIDLAKLGVLGLLRESAQNRGGMIGEGLLSWGLASFSDRFSVQGMNCHEGKISVLVKVE